VPRDPHLPLRVALISTPRAGNNWLRHLLVGLYQVPSLPVHTPREIDWAALPRECLLAVHWHPSPSFLERLDQHGFQMIVLARHPLDVLISILHFALHYSSTQATQRWLEGEDGNERSIFGAMPRSTAFLDYATGRRAGALLAVSQEWWQVPGCLKVRYEEVLQDPQGTLQRLAEGLGVPGRALVAEVVAANSMAKLRHSTGSKYHFWQGQSGLWRHLLPAAETALIADAHQPVFAALGYEVDPDPHLNGAQADANWIKLIWEELAEDLHTLRECGPAGATALSQVNESRRAYAELVEKFTAVQNQLLATQVTYQDMLAKFTLAQQTVGEMRARCEAAEREHAALLARATKAEETSAFLRAQISPRSKLKRPLASLARWVSRP
jgi:Sulfotransferase domain